MSYGNLPYSYRKQQTEPNRTVANRTRSCTAAAAAMRRTEGGGDCQSQVFRRTGEASTATCSPRPRRDTNYPKPQKKPKHLQCSQRGKSRSWVKRIIGHMHTSGTATHIPSPRLVPWNRKPNPTERIGLLTYCDFESRVLSLHQS
jgi:hypothetical protein